MYENVGLVSTHGQYQRINDVHNVSNSILVTSNTERPRLHDVSRMLNETNDSESTDSSTDKPYTATLFIPSPYRITEERHASSSIESQPELGADKERQSSCATPPPSDTSMMSTSPASSTTSGTETPPSRSCSSSSGSGCESATSPVSDSGPVKKKARTNYTAEQIKALEKVFFENPYPDFQEIETMSKDLVIPESNIKIWFQNKRARWRRRANDARNNISQKQQHVQSTTMYPMMQQYMPYNYMTYPSPLMTSNISQASTLQQSPLMTSFPHSSMNSQYVPGYMSWMNKPHLRNDNNVFGASNNWENMYNTSRQVHSLPPYQNQQMRAAQQPMTSSNHAHPNLNTSCFSAVH